MPRAEKLPPGFYRKRDIIYCYVWSEAAGERRPASTGCKDARAAIVRARELERIAADPRAAAAEATTLTDAIMVKRADLEQLVTAGRRSPRTLDFFDEKAQRLQDYLEHEHDESGRPLPCTCATGQCLTFRPLKLSALQPPAGAELVDRHIGWRRTTVSDHSIGKELTVLRGVLKLAKRHGKFSGDLDEVLPIDFETGYEPVDRWLPMIEVGAVARELHREVPDQGARVAFMVATGAEWAATENVLDEDVGTEMVHLPGTKRQTRDRTVPIVTPWQAEFLEFALRHAGGQDGKLFAPWSNRGRDIKAACERAGIASCSPNDLRRTFATWLRAEGYAPHDIAVMMGHVDSRMVEKVYARLDPNQLRAIMLQRTAPGSTKTRTQDTKETIETGVDLKTPSELAPRARFERATHGLTVREAIGLSCGIKCAKLISARGRVVRNRPQATPAAAKRGA